MIAAIIQARLGSSRLPGKVMREVNGRPLLSYMLERVAFAKSIGQLAVATTDKPQDGEIEVFCGSQGIHVYRGSEDDVLDRYYRCAAPLKPEAVVRLTSDCPLIDPSVIDEVVGVFQSGNYDYVANTAPPVGTYPDGMDVEVFSFAALERAWRETTKPSDREHVTFCFWQNPHLYRTRRHDLLEDLSKYRLTVDYPEDLELIRSVVTALYPQKRNFSLADILDFLRRNPDVLGLNTSRAWNEGWQSAFEKDKQAGY